MRTVRTPNDCLDRSSSISDSDHLQHSQLLPLGRLLDDFQNGGWLKNGEDPVERMGRGLF